ncbi:MAG TPA: HAD family hydrolase [Thermoplasmata archaeon]|nr:HAD family hydrolase [Thermoplasmata archaeon]
MASGSSGARGAGAHPRALLFDLDDTIFDHSLTCRAALAALCEEAPYLRARPLDDLWQEYGRLLGETHAEVMLGRRSSDDARRERFQRLGQRVGRTVTASEADGLSRSYRAHYQSLRRPVAGAPETVRRLHTRARIAIVTNNTIREQEEKLEFLGLRDAVDLLVTSEEIGVAKPDPSIFRAALDRAGVAAADAVMVGDSWHDDIEGARAARIRPIWFNRFGRRPLSPGGVLQFATFEGPRRLDTLLLASDPAPG